MEPAGPHLASLLKPENKKKLAAILTYHVVSGDVNSAKVMKMHSAKTVNGEEVTITTEGENVSINGANVTSADIACKNGTIHVIDTVLMPKA
jgi:transforming growth factor-beta-induced protein